jgi:Transcriptional regulators
MKSASHTARQYSDFIPSDTTAVEYASLPAYLRVERSIKNAIEQRLWRPGDLIPSEPHLAKSHGVSIGTVKKALHNLAAAGFLYRIQGKGTYVAGSFIRSEGLRFYRTLPGFDAAEPPYSLHFLCCGQLDPDDTINADLRLAKEAPLILLERMMRMDNKPFVYIQSHFAAQGKFLGLLDETKERIEAQALTLLIESDYDTPTMRCRELISAVAADGLLADTMQQPKGAPLVCMEMLLCTYKDAPYEYRRAYCVPGKKIFRTYS